jgi:tight adherence protein B
MNSFVLIIIVFVGVTGLIGSLAMLIIDNSSTQMDNRFKSVTQGRAQEKNDKKSKKKLVAELLSSPIETNFSPVTRFLERFSKLELWFEQANSSLTFGRLLIICGGFGFIGLILGVVSSTTKPYIWVLSTLTMSLLPFVWLYLRRARRLKKFAAQLPEAMDMLGRSLRSGHSLSAGISLVAKEMSEPLSMEFGRVFDEQNLGIPMDESLDNLTQRIPSLDLKFFCTAVILQRQTGGDLAEILDKISHIIRERFAILGQVQALTGEGRISGIVLLALPILLFGVVYYLNPDYIMLLFEEPMGKKMLVGAIILQVVGALSIRKIVNIKV